MFRVYYKYIESEFESVLYCDIDADTELQVRVQFKYDYPFAHIQMIEQTHEEKD